MNCHFIQLIRVQKKSVIIVRLKTRKVNHPLGNQTHNLGLHILQWWATLLALFIHAVRVLWKSSWSVWHMYRYQADPFQGSGVFQIWLKNPFKTAASHGLDYSTVLPLPGNNGTLTVNVTSLIPVYWERLSCFVNYGLRHLFFPKPILVPPNLIRKLFGFWAIQFLRHLGHKLRANVNILRLAPNCSEVDF